MRCKIGRKVLSTTVWIYLKFNIHPRNFIILFYCSLWILQCDSKYEFIDLFLSVELLCVDSNPWVYEYIGYWMMHYLSKKHAHRRENERHTDTGIWHLAESFSSYLVVLVVDIPTVHRFVCKWSEKVRFVVVLQIEMHLWAKRFFKWSSVSARNASCSPFISNCFLLFCSHKKKNIRITSRT